MSFELERNRLFRIGKHATAGESLTAPGSMIFVEPASPFAPNPAFEQLDRPSQRADGSMRPAINGRRLRDLGSPAFHLRGLETVGGDGVTVDASAHAQILDVILEAVFGSAPTEPTGETTDASDAGTGTTVTASTSTSFAAGDLIAIEGATSGRLQPRQVVSVSGADITIDRTLLDDTGAAEDAAEDSVIYALASWEWNPDTSSVKHLAVDYERETGRRLFVGALPTSCVFNFAEGQPITCTLNGLSSTTWSDEADANPSFSLATEGSEIIALDERFYIGGAQYLARDHQITVDLGIQPLTADAGPNGHLGFVRVSPSVTWTCSIYRGSDSRAATEAFENTLQGVSTQDLALAVGTSAGALAYWRMPAATIQATHTALDGLEGLALEARATRVSTSGIPDFVFGIG